MTWREIKEAVAQAGVKENEEIALIQCENGKGNHTFHKVTLGKRLKLAENVSEEISRKEADGVQSDRSGSGMYWNFGKRTKGEQQ